MQLRTLSCLVLLMSSIRAAILVPATWSTPTTGNLGGNSILMTGLSSPFLGIQSTSFVSSDFSADPIASAQEIQYGASNSWSASFGSAVNNLLLYVDSWRGAYTSSGPPDPTTHYTFNVPFTILSGLGGSTTVANTLVLPPGRFYSGILSFSGPITSLSVVSDGLNQSGQDLTFALANPVPEPADFVLFASGLVFLALRVARRLRAQI